MNHLSAIRLSHKTGKALTLSDLFLRIHNMLPKGFKCKHCGHCCIDMVDAYQNVAMIHDMKMWGDKGRSDVLEWVDPYPCEIKKNGRMVVGYRYWVNPRTGEVVKRCPWLRKVRGQDQYVCRINDVKPAVCRNYPLTKAQAKKTGCKGFDK